MELKIDPEFEALMPKTDMQCNAGLEASLRESNGPIDPIIVWQKHNVIIDGHRRYRICQKLGLPFEVQMVDLEDRDAVKTWMRMWQIDRRNLSNGERKAFRSALAATLVEKGLTRKAAVAQVTQSADVDERTAHRDVDLAKAMQKIDPAVRAKMVKADLPTLEYKLMAKQPVEKQREILNGIEDRQQMKHAIRSTETLKPLPSVLKPIPRSGTFTKTLDDARKYLGHALQLIAMLSKEVSQDLDFKDCRRMLGDVDEILQRWKIKHDQ